jgi:predicted DNA-binding transcriptional regulator YafY
MRGDRLVGLLMLLQARGRMTAQALAAELEVSERTIYRDIDALSLAGVPIYGAPGPDGGYALLDAYRSTLTGLSEPETRALLMLSAPGPLGDLGLGQDLRRALSKLAAALPDARRVEEERARRRFHLDFAWWEHDDAATVPHLRTVHQAVLEDRRLHIVYAGLSAPALARRVEPYGLVAKAGDWYLVYAVEGRVRVRRVATLLDAQLSDQTFTHPPDFDLVAFWAEWRRARAADRRGYWVTLAVAPAALEWLRARLGRGAVLLPDDDQAEHPVDECGRFILEVAFASLEDARDRLLGFGRGVEVLAPLALRCSVADFGRQIAALYDA